jgi:Holliday junction resolvasome RuvABC endonuclease subunit
VRAHAGVDAAHAYGGALATVSSWCEERGIPYEGIPVATIKKHATGKGNAKKDAMMAAASSRWPSVTLEDDNHADALWIGDLANNATVSPKIDA